jgi:cytosine/adenosine deaminase-related metal-dependent hydrolase
MSLLLRNALLADRRSADLLLANGRIARIADAGTLAAEDAEVRDLAGLLLLPGLVEGHIHLDKTLLGLPWIPHVPGGSIPERIEAEKRLRRGLALPIADRAETLLARSIGHGVTSMRCHVDIDDEIGLAGVEALLELRQRWRDRIDVQLVAFPQSGILRQTRTADLMAEAMTLGVEVVGGLDPAGYDGDVEAHVAIVFGLAERYGAMVDIHLHDFGELGAFELRRIAERSAAAGMQGRVAVSHAFALGALDDMTFGRTAEALAGGGVAIMTAVPGPVPMPPVKRLTAAGVTVFAGSDNIRDTWSPLGNGDPLDRARLVAWRQGFATDEELELAFAMATEKAAEALGIGDYGVMEGRPGRLVAIEAPHVAAAVAECPQRRLVADGYAARDRRSGERG